MTRTEQEILEEAFDSLEFVAAYVSRSTTPDQMTVDAICMRIVAGVEALTKLPEQRGEELFGDSWIHMRAMRNRIVHGYQFIDPKIVLKTARLDVPQVLAVITSHISD